MADDFKKAILIVWIVVSIVLLGIVTLPFILPDYVILNMAPRCEWVVKYNKLCPLCGMTRAFLEISRLDIKEALFYNRSSIYLYSFLSANSILFLLWPLIRLVRQPSSYKKH